MELINIHTIKPLDTEAVIKSLTKTGCAVTAEEHNVLGGLGDSIAQVAARHIPCPIEYVGTNDTFGESGKPTDLLKSTAWIRRTSWKQPRKPLPVKKHNFRYKGLNLRSKNPSNDGFFILYWYKPGC
ncbi:hypothetical protein MKQ70_30855 [Chitinophaga sedimenti]|uniref:transketolase C-terminal domain-containing protein n=1 Tax=Chitinophaga sedimenti TaxID=2033606 RepID=UPI002004B2CB|nr:transketolase C-terminal domain-containing protein [Chitinophaga sedimenti]MCK7559134.1 hypothetical protein [Chitinophaga sedimenti]